MDFRKQAKESRGKKLHQLTVSGKDSKVDASDFTPYANPEMDKKTGLRPKNPRAFKRGGKVAALDGDKAQKRGDRLGAKGRAKKNLGGDITAGGNPQIPSAKGQTSLLRKAVGLDYNKGGRTKKAYGGRGVGERTQTEESRRAAVKAGEDYGVDPRVSEDDLRKATRDYEQKKTETGYKKGGRAKKADGGGDDSYAAAKMRRNAAWDKAKAEGRPGAYDKDVGKASWEMRKALALSQGRPVPEPFGNYDEKKHGGATKKMNGGPMMAGPAQTLMKRKTPMNNPAAKAPMVMPMRAKGGKVSEMEWEHSKKDLAEDKKLAKKHGMSLEKWEKSEADKKHDKQQSTKGLCYGGRTKKEDGGSTPAPTPMYHVFDNKTGDVVGKFKNRNAARAMVDRKDNDYGGYNYHIKTITPGEEMEPKASGGRAGGKWIQKAIKKPGALHKQLGVPEGKKIPAEKLEEAAEKGGKLGKRARLAQTLGRMNRASGGRAKGKSNINIVIAPQPAAQGGMPPMGMGMPPRPPMPMPMPPAPPAAGAPGGMPPAGGAMPIPVPMPMGGAGGAPAPAPQGAGVPGLPGMAPLPRKSGGRIKSYKDMTAGAGSGEGRLQKEEMAEYKRVGRKAGGSVPNMTAGAGSGPGRIEKIHAYGENPHGDAAPKPKKRSWIA